MTTTLVEQASGARTPSSRGYREPSDDPPRLPGAAIAESSYLAAARIRAALQASPYPLTVTELARAMGIEPRSLTPLLAGATFALRELFETDRGRLGLLGVHESYE